MKVTVDIITRGNIPMAILRKAECENVSSIIIGSRGRGRVKGLLLGSVSADIVRHGKTHLFNSPFNFPALPCQGARGAVLSRFCPGIVARALHKDS